MKRNAFLLASLVLGFGLWFNLLDGLAWKGFLVL
jgi:hypothetical protein